MFTGSLLTAGSFTEKYGSQIIVVSERQLYGILIASISTQKDFYFK